MNAIVLKYSHIFKRRDENVAKTDDVLVTDVLEQFEFTVSSLGENWSGEGLHDLLDGHRCVCELVVGGADETESTHSDGLQVDISGGDLEDGTEDG